MVLSVLAIKEGSYSLDPSCRLKFDGFSIDPLDWSDIKIWTVVSF